MSGMVVNAASCHQSKSNTDEVAEAEEGAITQRL